MNPVSEAYSVLFGQPPDNSLEEWRVAKAVIDNFDGSKLDEVTARNALESIIVDVDFPDHLAEKIVGRAENLLPEVSADYSPDEEVHMAVVERVRFLRQR